jgi:hypothetical protein
MGWIRRLAGTGNVAFFLRKFRSFTEARTFVRELALKTPAAWKAYCKLGRRPADIPTHPHVIYSDEGWVGMSDWLGTGKAASGQHLSFKNARAFVRALRLKSYTEWIDYCKSGKKPADIPASPEYLYKNQAGLASPIGSGMRARDSHSEARG